MDKNLKVNSPLVSVVMSCYNSEKYLRESIDSILAQTYTNFEFIIWNDGSKDSTEEIVKSYNDTRIRYFSAENQGLGKALNCACKHVKGKYIARMDDDDIALPKRFEKEVAFLETNPEYILVSCASKYIDENGRSFGSAGMPACSDKVIKIKLCISHPGVMFLKDAYFKTKGYLPVVAGGEDAMLWKQMSRFGKFANLPYPLLYYRIQSKSIGRRLLIPEFLICCKSLRDRIAEDAIAGIVNANLISIHNSIVNINAAESVKLNKPLYSHQKQNNLSLWIYKLLKKTIGENNAILCICKIKTWLFNFIYTIK